MQSMEDIEVVSLSTFVHCESANSSEQVYIPQVRGDVIPKIGQHFDNLDMAQKFYYTYPRESGFGTRINSSKKSRQHEVIRKEYCCYKEGTRKTNANNVELTVRRRGLTREGCGAKMSIVKDKSGKGFVVSQFLEGHNHPLTTPRGVHLLHSHRGVSLAKRALTQQLSAANVPTCQQMAILELNAGGLANVGCLQQDLYNAERDRRKALLGQDDNMFSECFDYEEKKNLGCAFLNHENVESFEWLIRVWLEAMPGPPPKMLITDQDPAMKVAVQNTLPNTHHRYCIWYIVNKFSEKIGALAYKQHYDEFKHCIWKSESPEEFEARWVDVVQKANLETNEWLHGLFKIRDRWVPIYMKHIFSAHMTSSQRAEKSHAFFKSYVSSQNSLWDFITRFDRGLARIRHNELDLDHKDINKKLLLKTMWVMELTLRKLYTWNIFYKFQDELFQNSTYLVTKTFEDEHRCLYNVQRDVENAPKGREVSVDKSSAHVCCSCKMFESDGIPCRHMLAYFTTMQIGKLPEQYILRRWTESAKAGRVRENLAGGLKEICDTSLVVRRSKIFKRASNVIEDAVLTEAGTAIMDEALEFIEKKFAALKTGSNDGDGDG